jgi:hypothetical protein
MVQANHLSGHPTRPRYLPGKNSIQAVMELVLDTQPPTKPRRHIGEKRRNEV